MNTTENTPVESSLRGLLSRLMHRPTVQPATGTVAQVEPSPSWWKTAVVHGRDHEGKDTAIPTETFFTRFKANS